MENQSTQIEVLQQKEQSIGLIAILTSSEQAKDFERGLTIQKIIETALPISVVKQHAGLKSVCQALDIQLTKLVASLNLKWNLNDTQIQGIVEDLVDKYPNETIEDFILIFKMARQNKFGELYRLDSAVIFGWVDAYLEEKYKSLEEALMKEKDNPYATPVKEPENYKPLEGVERDKMLDQWKDSVSKIDVKPVLPLSPEEIKKEGQERPMPKYYHPSDPEYLAKVLEFGRECQEKTVRERHPEWNDEQVQARLEELRSTPEVSTDVNKIVGLKWVKK